MKSNYYPNYNPHLAEDIVQGIFETSGKWKWYPPVNNGCPFPQTRFKLSDIYSEVVADMTIGSTQMIKFEIIGTIPTTDIEINIQGTSGPDNKLRAIVQAIETCHEPLY